MDHTNQHPFLAFAGAGALLRLKKGLPTTCAGGDCPNIRKHGDRVYSQIVELKERSLEFRANSAFQNRMAVGAQIDSMNQVRETQASFRTQESES
jgi:exosome complex RNA-binding protein Csl4